MLPVVQLTGVFRRISPWRNNGQAHLAVWLLGALITVRVLEASQADSSLSGVPSAQATSPIDLRECARGRCDISLRLVAVLSDSADPGILPELPSVQQDKSGRFYTAVSTMDAIAVFDRSGTFERLVGSRGAGPGEFVRVSTPLPGPGDSLFAFDMALQRVSVISPDLRVRRQYPLSHQPSLVLPGGLHVISQQVGTLEASGYPIHLMREGGRIERSFGSDLAQHRPDLWLATTRVVGPAAARAIWAAAPGKYILERWLPETGARLQSVRVRTSWFQESDFYNDDETRPPTSIIAGVWQDQPQVVWVLLRVADSEWRAPALANRERVATMASRDIMYDSILEAVHAETGQTLASLRLRSLHTFRPPTPLIASTRLHVTGRYEYLLWRPQLKPKGAAR